MNKPSNQINTDLGSSIPKIKPRRADSYKGNFGRALIIAGSRGMSGAASLVGLSAIKSGAGLVTLAVPECCLPTVASFNPCYMTLPINSDHHGLMAPIDADRSKLARHTNKATCIGIGPGLSQSPAVTTLVEKVYSEFPGPMVVDADALNAIASLDEWPHAAGPRILTPHIGEFRRLVRETDLPSGECPDRAKQLAEERQVIVVLKGNRTLVTDGSNHFENSTGNPGMATGGSGDVLTGIITALLGQEYASFEAATLGVHVHGLAGDLALKTAGHEMAVDALGIANEIGHAFGQLSAL